MDIDAGTAKNAVGAGQKNTETETSESENVKVKQEIQENKVLEDIRRDTSKTEIAETELCQSEEVDVKRETLENEILETIRKAGLDDKFWIKKIREVFKVETVEELRNVTKDQVEVFLQNTEITIQSRLRPVFSNLIGVDVSSRETVTSESVDVEHEKVELESSQKADVRQNDDVKHKSTEEYPNSVAFTVRGIDENLEVIYSQSETEYKGASGSSVCQDRSNDNIDKLGRENVCSVNHGLDEEKQVDSLREELQKWEEYNSSHPEHLESSIRKLVHIRKKYSRLSGDEWRYEVLYQRNIQMAMMRRSEIDFEEG